MNFDGMDWIYLAQGGDEFQAPVHSAMKFWVP